MSDQTEAAISARTLITDALAIAYGTDGDPAEDYWAEGADLIVTTLVESGWLPPEADPPSGSPSMADDIRPHTAIDNGREDDDVR